MGNGYKTPARNRLSVSVSKTLAERLAKEEQDTGLSASEIVRVALDEHLSRKGR